LGGRKKGRRNVYSAALRKALAEAAYRIGSDGSGHDGVRGYFHWLAIRHPKVFSTEMLGALLVLQPDDSGDPPPLPTAAEIDRALAASFGLARTPGTDGAGRPAAPHRDGTDAAALLGSLTDVGSLMRVAVRAPQKFCRLFAAALLTVPKHRRGPGRGDEST
jgi:hypothetical protein